MGTKHDRELAQAITDRDAQSALSSLKNGANPNSTAKCLTPLNRAIIGGSHEMTRLLLRNGADPNHADQAGYTALHWAAMGDDPEMMSLLIEAGGNVNAVNPQGSRPLDLASEGASAELISSLKDAGAVSSADQAAWMKRVSKRRQAPGTEEAVVTP